MEFKTVYNAHELHEQMSNAGEPERPNYKPMYIDNGSYELVEDGVLHSYEDIQAWAPSCDMSVIIERYIRTGDSSLLNNRAGFYEDVTNLPTNYADLHNMLQHANDVFAALPLDVREAFEHNPALFYADKAQADSVISDVIKARPEVVEPSVVPEGGVEVE